MNLLVRSLRSFNLQLHWISIIFFTALEALFYLRMITKASHISQCYYDKDWYEFVINVLFFNILNAIEKKLASIFLRHECISYRSIFLIDSFKPYIELSVDLFIFSTIYWFYMGCILCCLSWCKFHILLFECSKNNTNNGFGYWNFKEGFLMLGV